MNFRHILSLAPTLAAVALAGPSPAQATSSGFADLAAIDSAVAGFVGQSTGMPGGARAPVDRRLRLNRCTGALTLAWHGETRDSVIVQCPDPDGWHVYVAIAAGGSGLGGDRGSITGSETESGLAPGAQAINRGEAVTIAVTGDGFTVSQPGEALEPGVIGGWIRVRSAAKADPLRARVVRPGLVSFTVE